MATAPQTEVAYLTLAHWCSVSKAWHHLPGQYESVRHAEDAAHERGVYRVMFVCDDRRLTIELLARLGGDD